MATHADWDRLVNSKWPTDIRRPEPEEALAFAKAVYRKGMGRAWKGKIKLTSGNRFTFIRRGVLSVNPNRTRALRPGFPDILHQVAHLVHHERFPKNKPHASSELYIERDLTDWVLAKGYLDGSLKKTPKPTVSVVEKRAKAVEASIARAEAKLKKLASDKKRTERRLAALKKKKRYYDNRV